ncbi:hypothetical protein BD779DRAFT_1025396 [Infundibulicybe gibba]|nr:hypothetical protein BD779DRAFT_1025396 [Infundibulicybe gibba]
MRKSTFSIIPSLGNKPWARAFSALRSFMDPGRSLIRPASFFCSTHEYIWTFYYIVTSMSAILRLSVYSFREYPSIPSLKLSLAFLIREAWFADSVSRSTIQPDRCVCPHFPQRYQHVLLHFHHLSHSYRLFYPLQLPYHLLVSCLRLLSYPFPDPTLNSMAVRPPAARSNLATPSQRGWLA